MRPIMTRAELARHEVSQYGRDYSRSDDGYSDMEVAAEDGWQAVAGWGRNGWDLGNWPYVVISVRDRVEVFGFARPGQFYDATPERLAELCERDADFYEVTYEARQTVEGDTT